MSAQGATLRRGTVHIPIWPVAVVVLAATAAAIGLSSIESIDSTAPARTLVTVPNAQRLANSTAAVREQGAVAPTIDLTNSGVAIQHRGFAVRPGLEPTTAFREQGAALPVIVGISHVAPSVAYGTGWDSVGGQNEALHRQYSPPQEGAAPKAGANPIMVNGEACMQCR